MKRSLDDGDGRIHAGFYVEYKALATRAFSFEKVLDMAMPRNDLPLFKTNFLCKNIDIMTRNWESSEDRSSLTQTRDSAHHNLALILYFVIAVAGMFGIYGFFSGDLNGAGGRSLRPEAAPSEILLAPISKPIKADTKEMVVPVIDQSHKNVAIIAGHRGSDSGTECADGLTEVQITSALAERLAATLRDAGIETNTYDEFDERLQGLNAAAVVSIHIDSCDFINELATGFKISGSNITDSSTLSICIQQRYSEATNLLYHANSITPHMAGYHAFRKIAPGTPAVIIEAGFLNLDREILTMGAEKVVAGLRDGILCYMESRQ